jgi:protein-disulfide isomerase
LRGLGPHRTIGVENFHVKTILAGILLALPLLSQESTLDKKAVAEIVRYNERWPQKWTIRIVDAAAATELPGYRKILAQGIDADHIVIQKTYYVSPDGSRVIQANIFPVGEKPFNGDLSRMHLSDAPSYGPPTAPVSLVLFSDFQCPFCASDAKMFRENIPRDFPHEVRVIFKDYPMHMHPWAMDAAIAGRCIYHARAQAFWAYHDWMFAHQRDVNAQNVRRKIMDWAASAQFDSAALETCLASHAAEAEVRQSMADGLALGIDGTPALLLNGRAIEPGREWDVIKYYIDYELNAAPALESCCTVQLPAKK